MTGDARPAAGGWQQEQKRRHNMEKILETRVQSSNWDLATYKWKIESDAMKLLVQGFKEKKVLGRKCDSCGTVYVPGSSTCRKCLKDIDTVVEVKNTGTIGTFTVNLADIRGNPLEKITIVVCVKLEGSDSWLMGRLEGWKDWKSVRSGQPVQIVWSDNPQGVLADLSHFELL